MVVASMERRIYHLEGCCCGARILGKNRMKMHRKEAEREGLHPCKRCNRMSYHYNAEFNGIKSYCNDNGLSFKMENDELLVQTDMGFWRIKYYPDTRYFRLYHGNFKPKSAEIRAYRWKDYHFQKDIPHARRLMEYITYIKKHDDYRRMGEDNFKALPQDSKKQKMYYRRAVNRKKREDRNRVNRLFAMLEREDPSLKKVAMEGMA